MSKKKNNTRKLPSVESMIIWVAVISFALWAFSKCSKDDFKDIREKALDIPSAVEEVIDTLDTGPITNTTIDTTTISPAPVPTPTPTAISPPSSPKPATAAEPALSRLYVTIDGLKMRSEPSLSGPVLERLPLFASVYFMNEVTDSTQKINLGRAIADEPWVKVKSAKGKVGWVYGAGVHYHKQKNEDAY